MRLRNINPLGQVDVPLLGRQGEPLGEEEKGCLEPAEVFDCTPEQASNLLAQVGNYEPADEDAAALFAELFPEPEPAAEPDSSSTPDPAGPDAGDDETEEKD